MTDDLEILFEPVNDVGLQRVIGQSVPAVLPAMEFNLWEQTREETIKLVQRLSISTSETAAQVVVFAAVERGSGCTWVCARTAEMMADHLDVPVCVVDANFRSPGLRLYFEVEDPERASERWLSAPDPPSENSLSRANLWLWSYSPPDRGWQTPSSLDRFQERISKLRKHFTYILIDAPPINAHADAALLGRMADGVVMVMEANKTRREAAQRAKGILDAAGVQILGAVLNKRTFPIPKRLYKRL